MPSSTHAAHRGLFDFEEIESPDIPLSELALPPLQSEMQALYRTVLDRDPAAARFNADSLHFVLSHPQVVDYIEELRRSKFSPFFERYSHLFLMAPASEYSPDMQRKHDCHTHGLLVHSVRVRQHMLADNLRPEWSLPFSQILEGGFLHDIGKMFTYVRIESSNFWKYRKADNDPDQSELARFWLARSGVDVTREEDDLLRYQDMDKRAKIATVTDLMMAVNRADAAAVRESRKPAHMWQGGRVDCKCHHPMKFSVPYRFDPDEVGERPMYSCPTRNAKCGKPLRLADVAEEERRQFFAWLQEAFPAIPSRA